jgi:hypothetical protein
MSVGEDLFHDAAHQVHGDREADALGTTGTAVQHGRVDADQVAVRVDEGATGVAEIDGCIRLDEILECSKSELTATRGAHDALGHGLAEAIGIADGEYDVARAQRIGATQGHDGEVADRQIEHRDIGIGVLAGDAGIGHAPIRELYADGVGAVDHVLIGDDGTLRIDDDPRAQTALDALPVARPVVAQ